MTGLTQLNKFCVLPRHFLLVTKEFAPQALPPTPRMLATAFRMITSHAPQHEAEELFGFYNCGPDSGASQPHCHFQLIEARPTDGSTSAVPIEALLARLERDGQEHGT